MLILGVTSDDKGAQLEALVQATLVAEGYEKITRNFIGAGGDEIDVAAQLVGTLVGQSHTTPVMCEAKAYAKAITLPIWHRFLGKVFIQRAANHQAVGVLIALNGVSGNVRGNFEHLRLHDSALMIVDGNDLESRAIGTGELLPEIEVRKLVKSSLEQDPLRLDSTYYGGGFSWVARWGQDQYSIVDGRGAMLAATKIEQLRPALEATISGQLVAAKEVEVLLEQRHAERVRLLNLLFRGRTVAHTSIAEDHQALFDELASEEFTSGGTKRLRLVPAEALSATGVSRLFQVLFQGPIRVESLSFVAERLHDPYVQRLVDLLPDLQHGFAIETTNEADLRAIAPLFPSIWATLAKPIAFLAGHEAGQDDSPTDRQLREVDNNAFWEEMQRVVRSDFSNVYLRGFLFDHLGVAELEERRTVKVKTKELAVGTMATELRDAIARLGEELAGEAGTNHALVRILPTVAEPWDQTHPDPAVILDEIGK